MSKLYMGIDPGVSGAWAVIDEDENIVRAFIFGNSFIPPDGQPIELACLEQVHSMPKQGVKSVWSFAENYGFWKGILWSYNIPSINITPMKWQKAILDSIPAKKAAAQIETSSEMNKRLAINKKHLKEAITNFARRYFRDSEKYLELKKNQGIADALCLALYAKRYSQGVTFDKEIGTSG